MPTRIPVLLALCVLRLSAVEVPTGKGDVVLVDGTAFAAEILFKHPHAERVVMRSARRTTIQSLPVALIHTISVGPRSATLSARRPLTDGERIRFQRNAVWGDAVGDGQIGAYADEDWADAPVAVWAHPGTDGSAFDPANWLDRDGKPYTALHWDAKASTTNARQGAEFTEFVGDILLPGADRPYHVLQSGTPDKQAMYRQRHMTVEENATYLVSFWVTGNFWLKDGGATTARSKLGSFGLGAEQQHDVFLRFASHEKEWEAVQEWLVSSGQVDAAIAREDLPGMRWAYPVPTSHWMRTFWGSRSGEVIGHCGGPSDRITVESGTLIVSRDSSVGAGYRSAFAVNAGASLVLLDGARVGCSYLTKGGTSGSTVGTYGIDGTIRFGTPEHPLTRDLPFEACLYPTAEIGKSLRASERAMGASIVFGPNSRIEIHSIDPRTARVVFRLLDRNRMPVGVFAGKEAQAIRGFANELRLPNSYGKSDIWIGPADRGLWTSPDRPATWADGISIAFLGQADLDGVVFDHVAAGGLIAPRTVVDGWRNVTWGEHNAGPLGTLLRQP